MPATPRGYWLVWLAGCFEESGRVWIRVDSGGLAASAASFGWCPSVCFLDAVWLSLASSGSSQQGGPSAEHDLVLYRVVHPCVQPGQPVSWCVCSLSLCRLDRAAMPAAERQYEWQNSPQICRRSARNCSLSAAIAGCRTNSGSSGPFPPALEPTVSRWEHSAAQRETGRRMTERLPSLPACNEETEKTDRLTAAG